MLQQLVLIKTPLVGCHHHLPIRLSSLLSCTALPWPADCTLLGARSKALHPSLVPAIMRPVSLQRARALMMFTR